MLCFGAIWDDWGPLVSYVFVGVFCLLYRGLTPYEKVRFALFWSNLGRLGALGFLRLFWYFVFYVRGLTPYEKNVAWRGTYSFHKKLLCFEAIWDDWGSLVSYGSFRILSFL